MMLEISSVSDSYWKVLQVVLLGTFKFVPANLLAGFYHFNYIGIFVTVSIGGILGVIFFYILSGWLIRVLEFYSYRIKAFWNSFYKFKKTQVIYKPKKIFTKRNRLIVLVINKYGLLGLSVLTPVFFSIPVGAFLAKKFYSEKEYVLFYLFLSVILWALVLSFIVSRSI